MCLKKWANSFMGFDNRSDDAFGLPDHFAVPLGLLKYWSGDAFSLPDHFAVPLGLLEYRSGDAFHLSHECVEFVHFFLP
jgi:hypothetical protein